MIELASVPVLIQLVPGPVLNPRWLAAVHHLGLETSQASNSSCPPPTELDNVVLVMEAKLGTAS